jgi:hypothetical protein
VLKSSKIAGTLSVMLSAIGSLSGVANNAGSEIGIAKIIGMEVDQRKGRKSRNGAMEHKKLIEK